MDFQPLLDATHPGPVHTITEGEVVTTWPQAGSAALLASVDLAWFADLPYPRSVDLMVDEPGAVNAVALTFRVELHDGIAHTLDPWSWPASSWATSVWVVPEPVEVGRGSALRVHYSCRVPGRPDGLTWAVVRGDTS